MATSVRIHWVRVVLAVIAAEALPIVLLVIVVAVYGIAAPPDALSPEAFAPLAGAWIGPIGGFLATLLFSYWVARRVLHRKLAHGAAVGVGTALLDLTLGLTMGGTGAIALLLISNAGRIVAGFLGGWFGARRDGYDSAGTAETKNPVQ